MRAHTAVAARGNFAPGARPVPKAASVGRATLGAGSPGGIRFHAATSAPSEVREAPKAVLKDPIHVPTPGCQPWSGEEEDPPLHRGRLELVVDKDRVSGYCLLLRDRLAMWAYAEKAVRREPPQVVVLLQEIVGLETLPDGFIINRLSGKVRVYVNDPAALRAWSSSILSAALTAPAEGNGTVWRPHLRPWQDAALRPRQTPHIPLGKSASSPSVGKARNKHLVKKSTKDHLADLDASAGAAVRSHRFRGELKAMVIVICQRLKAAAYTSQGQDWDKLFRDMDKDGSGQISFAEFCATCRGTLKLADDEAHLRACFRFLDSDHSGVIEVEELIAFITDPEHCLAKKGNLLELDPEAACSTRSAKVRHALAAVLMKMRCHLKAAAYKKAGEKWEQLLLSHPQGEPGGWTWEEFLQLCSDTLRIKDPESHIQCVFCSLDTTLSGKVSPDEVVAFVTDPVQRIHTHLKLSAARIGAVGCNGSGWEAYLRAQEKDKSGRFEWPHFRNICVRRLRMLETDAQLCLLFRALGGDGAAGGLSVEDVAAFMEGATVKYQLREPEKALMGRRQVGTRVLIQGREGTVRYAGTTFFAQGCWLGVEYDEPEGKHNGHVHGHQYFTCKDLHGIFVRPAAVKPVHHQENVDADEDDSEPEAVDDPEEEQAIRDFESLLESSAGMMQEHLLVLARLGNTEHRLRAVRGYRELSRISVLVDPLVPPVSFVVHEDEKAELELELMRLDAEGVAQSLGSTKVDVLKLTAQGRWLASRRPLGDRADAMKLEYSLCYDPVRPRSNTQPLSITIGGVKGLGAAGLKPYCVCAVPGKKTTRVQTQVVEGDGEVSWRHAAVVEDWAPGDQLTFAVWHCESGKWDTPLGRASLAAEDFATCGFDGELVLSDAGEGLTPSLSIKVIPRDATRKGTLSLALGNVYAAGALAPVSPRSRSPSPGSPAVGAFDFSEGHADRERPHSFGSGRSSPKGRNMRINTGRLEAAVLLQGSHAPFFMTQSERSLKGTRDLKDVSLKINEHMEPSQFINGKMSTGRWLTPRPGDGSTGVEGKVGHPGPPQDLSRSAESKMLLRASLGGEVSWMKVTNNSTHANGGFFSPRAPSPGATTPVKEYKLTGGVLRPITPKVLEANRADRHSPSGPSSDSSNSGAVGGFTVIAPWAQN